MQKKIVILGEDVFCGWSTALPLSQQGHEIIIVDNLSRRNIDNELETESLTPISSMSVRLQAWQEVAGNSIQYADLCDYSKILYTSNGRPNREQTPQKISLAE